ncbi:hypothetical protein [Epibacterium ulvae]|uniref:hypothetical protein n=1 Tax=Epibacterium ulvae TaxID=1156985 RepID=UPI00248F4AC1|nr:hypothetical protein [Epibacterium ulvae]
MPAVRRATKEDMPVIRDLLRGFRENHTPDFPHDFEYFSSLVEAVIDQPAALILLLDEDQGILIGMMLPTQFSLQPVAQELIWYTRKESDRRGIRLLKEYLNWAREKKSTHALCALKHEHPLMERMGFNQVQVGYYKRLEYDE